MTTTEGNVTIPKSKKDGGGVTKITVPTVVQRFAFVTIKGTAPLMMDRMSERVWIDRRNTRFGEIYGKKNLEDLVKPPAGTPEALFYEAIWQHTDGKPVTVTVKKPYVLPGHDEDFKISLRVGFPTSGLKGGMVRTAKDLLAQEIIKNKSLPGVFKRNAHIQGSVFPIQFERLEMHEMHITKRALVKWLPVFHNWTGTLLVSWNEPLLGVADVLTLIQNAGVMAALGVGRCEKGGEMGTYTIEGNPKIVSAIEAFKWIDRHTAFVTNLYEE
jgi:hypothetical protein